MTLTEAIVVKISHDLAGGIGAMASTTELMEIDPTFSVEAGGMLKQNSLMLMARLRFYRALFGAETKEINASIITDYLKTWGQKIDFEGKVENRLQLSLVAVGIILLVNLYHPKVKVGDDVLLVFIQLLKVFTVQIRQDTILQLQGKSVFIGFHFLSFLIHIPTSYVS